MKNSFFTYSHTNESISKRIKQLDKAKIGFYSIGPYAGSLAYNSAMQTNANNLLLAPRKGRSLLGGFTPNNIKGMDENHLKVVQSRSQHNLGKKVITNNLEYLIENCELVILSSNSNHVEKDIKEACYFRTKLGREDVLLGCLAGSFAYDDKTKESYVLAEKFQNLAFFSGFHRHGSLRNPLDSFTANFCHPNSLMALIGARMLDKLSPNIQVSPGVHNIEGQYIKAAKNISSIFAGFAYQYHCNNTGILPSVLTLLLNQCLDQAATVSMTRKERNQFYNNQPIPLTELGYGVHRIQASLQREAESEMVRDHTFAQLTAMVADVRGSMDLPVSGQPTRNFQAGQILSKYILSLKRLPISLSEFEAWCEAEGLQKGGLEGLKALRLWPKIFTRYGIELHDSSMINLLYLSIFGKPEIKPLIYDVLTKSRELSNFCQESVRPNFSKAYGEALYTIDQKESLELIIQAVKTNQLIQSDAKELTELNQSNSSNIIAPHLKAIECIEETLN
ncbi:hypothetical protein [Prochlorococcus sp. MIT 1341]|uniref:hypothetical protein n=1 Tax=Prochlorococcus sp. MIT 1341 TaxID=3096221 RepID=UPI002A747C8A|nr:hypothetical protein [Prochlorococcus sp. MIT 1341]